MAAISAMGAINYASPLHLTRSESDAQRRPALEKVAEPDKSADKGVEQREPPAQVKPAAGGSDPRKLAEALTKSLLSAAAEAEADGVRQKSGIELLLQDASRSGVGRSDQIASNRFVETLASVRNGAGSEAQTKKQTIDQARDLTEKPGSARSDATETVGRMDKTA